VSIQIFDGPEQETKKNSQNISKLTKCNEEIEKENIFLRGVCLNKCDFNKH